MEKKDRRVVDTLRVFSTIIKSAILPSFKIPNGGETVRTVSGWADAMEKEYGTLSQSRIVDYCVCQAYQMSKIEDDYISDKWKLSHSFSINGKSWDRYKDTNKRIKYYEDKWLSSCGLDRYQLSGVAKDRSSHPLSHLIYPEYEEYTKSRKINTEVGCFICEKSTLLYTPYSESCSVCQFAEGCQEKTQTLYPELYRIRMEAWDS